MRTFLHALLGFIASLTLAASAHAATHKTEWTCWLHGDTRVACTVIAAMDAARPAPAAAALPTRVPDMTQAQLMQSVRARPSATAGQFVFVPLYNVPFDESAVEQLVIAVLCGATPDCGAHYRTELNAFIAESPELFADMMDPVLVGAAL